MEDLHRASFWSKIVYMNTHPYSTFISNSETDCQALVREDKDAYIIAFRGTESLRDWMMNIRITRKRFFDCYVHSGFLKQYESVKNNIYKLLKNKNKRIICCGHSLGSALATLCAVDLRISQARSQVSCVTFGSPRVGGKRFRSLFNILVPNSIRVVHRFDPITYIPFRINYRHVGNIKRFTSPLSCMPTTHHSMDGYLVPLQN